MTYKEIRENKFFRFIGKQLSEIITINTYHGKDDVERSVRMINDIKKQADECIANGQDETSVNIWLEDMIGCFKVSEGGYTYDEISDHWRDKVNKLKSDAEKQLMQKALLLQKLSIKELDKNPQKSIAISKDCIKYIEATIYIAENINYEG